MWIRSQDRKILADVNAVFIHYNQVTYDIWGNDTDYLLGSYPTVERAMEVLDNIQLAIEKQLNTRLLHYLVVFQMPQDDEVE